MNDATLFNGLRIDLGGFEGWLRSEGIEVTNTDDSFLAKYSTREPVIYEIDEGRITIKSDLARPGIGAKFRRDALSITEKTTLIYTPIQPLNIEAMRGKFRELEDLFIILTNSEYLFRWPSVVLNVDTVESIFKWYSYRELNNAEPPEWYKCLTNFISLRDSFGQIVSTWMKKRERFGPGFYLYLGVRRALRLYSEHRFVNLIWGIEAFHRRAEMASTSSKIQARVARILEQVRDPGDKSWLGKRLRNAQEPNLEQRIFDLFSQIPIGLDPRRLRKFAKECGQRRNDISHFGAQRHGSNYDEFVADLETKSEALSTLYHMLILFELGVDNDLFDWWVNKMTVSYAVKSSFVEAGLFDRAILESKVPR